MTGLFPTSSIDMTNYPELFYLAKCPLQLHGGGVSPEGQEGWGKRPKGKATRSHATQTRHDNQLLLNVIKDLKRKLLTLIPQGKMHQDYKRISYSKNNSEHVKEINKQTSQAVSRRLSSLEIFLPHYGLDVPELSIRAFCWCFPSSFFNLLSAVVLSSSLLCMT